MRVARVILELGLPRSSCPEALLERRSVVRQDLLDEVDTNGSAYLRRIAGLMSTSSALGAEIVVFPAYTFVVGVGGLTLRRWWNAAVASGLVGVAGASLTPSSRPPREEAEFAAEEHLFAVESGETVFFPPKARSYGPLPILMGTRTTALAISSSVRRMWDYPSVFGAAAERATKSSPLLVFEAGHDQYPGTSRKTLVSTAAVMRARGASRVFVALSYWRWRGGKANGAWAVDGPKDTAFTRTPVQLADGRTDFIDLFTL